MTLHQFPCPVCHRVIRSAATMCGRTVACPACEHRFEVPTPATPPRYEEAPSDSCIGAVRSPLYKPPGK